MIQQSRLLRLFGSEHRARVKECRNAYGSNECSVDLTSCDKICRCAVRSCDQAPDAVAPVRPIPLFESALPAQRTYRRFKASWTEVSRAENERR
jgi:hypothetical protein